MMSPMLQSECPRELEILKLDTVSSHGKSFISGMGMVSGPKGMWGVVLISRREEL